MNWWIALVALAVGGEGKLVIERARGVPLARKALYEGGDSFTCLDGSETIPASQINDDYCDCSDGSDEPGTAACPNGRFHCVNLGHVGVNIPSSRVNDGICDCCDGSDEFASAVACPNNCDAIGRAAREERQRQATAMRAGFERRSELVKAAAQLRSEKEKELEQWRAEQTNLQPQKDSLNMAKEAAESAERQAKDAHAEAWKASRAERAKAKAQAAFLALDLNGDGILKAEELLARNEFDKDADGTVTLEEAAYYLMGKSQVDAATFVDDVWVGFKPIYKPDGSEAPPPPLPTEAPPPGEPERIQDSPPPPHQDEEVPLPEEIEYGPDGHVVDKHREDDEDHENDEDDVVEDFEKSETPPGDDEDDEPEPPYDEATQALVKAADEARSAYDEAERKLGDLATSIKGAEDHLNADFGPDSVFAPLKGTCVEWSDSQYTYKWCPFDRASQRDKSGGAETNLGSWGEWSGPSENRYSQLKMTRGTSCWNGPERSTVVKLSCGAETRLKSATEPGRCEYEFEAETPAVCPDPASLHAEDEL